MMGDGLCIGGGELAAYCFHKAVVSEKTQQGKTHHYNNKKKKHNGPTGALEIRKGGDSVIHARNISTAYRA